jgi:hypothetical protein
MITTALAFLSLAHAGSVFASTEPEITIGMGGTWGRFMPVTDGYWFFQGAGGDYWAEDVADDLSGYNDQDRVKLTDHGSLQDTQVERCDDGGWLVVGSYSHTTHDDSSSAWRLDASFGLVHRIDVAQASLARMHNDMTPLCTDIATGVAYQDAGRVSSSFIDLSSGEVGEAYPRDWNSMGGSLAVRRSDERILSADTPGQGGNPEIRISVFDKDWEPLETTTFDLPEGVAFWPERLLPLGDGWIVAYLGNERGSETGAVWLAALDADFKLVDSLQVTQNGPLEHRPWVVRKGDTLVVSYDRDVQPRATIVRLQPDAVPEDDGLLDTAGLAGGDDSAGDDNGGADPLVECACGTSAAPAAGLLAPLALYTRRRRRS